MTRLLTLAASVLWLGTAPVWAQSNLSGSSFGVCNQTSGDIAECLNRAIAERNDAAAAINTYGASGMTRYDVAPSVPPPTTTTTTTTTYSRTVYPPPYPGASR